MEKYTETLIIQGMNSIPIQNGEAIFSPTKIFSKPDSIVILKASSPAITRFYHEFLDKNNGIRDFNSKEKYLYLFSIGIRPCLIGEIFMNTSLEKFLY